jgi:predicted negative regulator of RcsB-dependent stress response
VDRISRKELKKDKFAQEVGHTVEFLEAHRKQLIRYGSVAAGLILLAAGLFYYNQRQHVARQQALRAALNAMQAPVSPSPVAGVVTFTSAEEKKRAVVKAFTDLAGKYPRSDEGMIAQYHLGAMALEEGRMEEAARLLNQVASGGNENYASLAKLSVAEIYAAQGKTAEAEKLLRQLMDKPTILVSREEAAIALAKLIAPARPEEARKLLDPLRSAPGAVGRAAMMAYGDLFVKR